MDEQTLTMDEVVEIILYMAERSGVFYGMDRNDAILLASEIVPRLRAPDLPPPPQT